MRISPEVRQVNLKGLIIGAIIVGLGGLLTGALVALISHVIYIVFLFAIGEGAVAAYLIRRIVRARKIRGGIWGIALGVWAALVTYGSYHYVNYLLFSLQAPADVVDEFLRQQTGLSGVFGYLEFLAQQGLTVAHLLVGNSSWKLGPVEAWVYWFIELCCIAYIGAGTGYEDASRPYCETHDRWYEKAKSAGGVPMAKAKLLMTLLQQKDFTGLGRLLEENAEMPSLELYIESCANCSSSPALVTIKQASIGSGGRVVFRNILNASISPSQQRALIQELLWLDPVVRAAVPSTS